MFDPRTPGQGRMFQGERFTGVIHSNDWVRRQRRPIPWIWEGLLAEKAVTLLSAPPKMGKTTLLSLLLDRRRAGGALLGRTVYPGKTIVCSEEDELLWALRQPPLDFGPDVIFHRPVDTTRRCWADFIDNVLTLSSEEAGPIDLVAIDTAARFIPLAQRYARRRQWALSELHMLTGMPAAVFLLNQSRTLHRPLAAFADIVFEMDVPRGVGPTRRRCFSGSGRYREALLQTATAELNAAGTDYELAADSPPPHPPLLTTLQSLLAQSPEPLSHRELLARWPGEAPRADSLWRTLARGCEVGLFVRSGEGTKTDAFRFGLAGRGKEAQGKDAVSSDSDERGDQD
jgi:hypothetical protein